MISKIYSYDFADNDRYEEIMQIALEALPVKKGPKKAKRIRPEKKLVQEEPTVDIPSNMLKRQVGIERMRSKMRP